MSDKKKRIELTILPGQEIHAVIFTGTEVDVREGIYMPFIDSHIHIESNNCAPLPLQWGLIRRKTAGFMSLQGSGRQKLTALGASVTGSFGRLGRLSTDLVAKILMCDINNMEFIEDLLWTFVSKGDLEKLEKSRAQEEAKRKAKIENKAAGVATKDISNLIEESEEHFLKFEKYASYYFGADKNKKKIIHMFIALPMDLSYAHYWGQFGFPVYLPEFKENGKIAKYYYFNDFLFISKKRDNNKSLETLYVDYDIDLEENKPHFDFNFPEEKLSEYNNKDDKHFYKHFIKEVPGETSETFEDYGRQMENTKAAAVMYPLQIIPFYHYDPRRHNKGNIDIANIQQNHVFFEYEKNININKIELSPKDFKKDELKKIFDRYQKTNDDIFKEINTKGGPYFGFKMYAELGYAPFDFDTYPNLEDFYQKCIDNKMPITVHCLAIGMTISDSHIYLKEAQKGATKGIITNKENEIQERLDIKWDFKNCDLSIKNSLRFIDELCVDPKNWERVFMHKGGVYKQLKVCFAHFGGYNTWCGREEDPFTKFDLKYSLKWRDTIIGYIKNPEYPNIYADLAYFINKKGSDDMEKVAKNLADALNNDNGKKDLKNHILMGSDWYMIEVEKVRGVSDFYGRIFRILKMVSEKVNFDAWYQFAVINPLRYLGLIERDGEKISSKGEDKLQAHKEYIEKMLGDADWANDVAGIDDNEKSDIKIRANLIKKIFEEYVTIEKSEEMKDPDDESKLLILKEPKVEEEE